MRVRYFCLLIFGLLFTAPTRAQSCGAVVYDSKDGLPSTNYLGIFQDSRGILWVGSYGSGVSFFDGKRWENWTTANKLFNNTVVNINEDKEGGIWFDHNEHGVSRWKDGKMQAFDFRLDTCAKGGLYFDRQQKKVFLVVNDFHGKASTRISEYDFSAHKFIDTGKRALPENIAANFEGIDLREGQNEDEWWAITWDSKKPTLDYYHVKNGQTQKLPVPSGSRVIRSEHL